jgi:hypothetical protein
MRPIFPDLLRKIFTQAFLIKKRFLSSAKLILVLVIVKVFLLANQPFNYGMVKSLLLKIVIKIFGYACGSSV